MVRIALLSLLFFCVYFSFYRERLFAYPMVFYAQDTIEKRGSKRDTLQLDTVLIKRKSAGDKWDEKKEEYKSIFFGAIRKTWLHFPIEVGLLLI